MPAAAQQWPRDGLLRSKELLMVAMAFASLALTFTAVGFSTNEWTVVKVDRVALKTMALEAQDTAYLITLHTDYNYFPRRRGLFETCFADNNETEFLKEEEFYKANSKCLYEPALRPKEAKQSWGNDYRTRNDLVRTHLAVFGIGMGFLFLSCASGLIACAALNTCVLLVCSVCSVIGFIGTFAGMIVYHIYDDSETHDLDYKPFGFYWSKDSALRENSTVAYGFSFGLAWAGTGLCLVTTVIFWAAYFTLRGYFNDIRRKPRIPYERRQYSDIDIYSQRRHRPRNIQHWRDIKIPASENIRNYYLHSEPSYTGSNKRLYPVSDRRLTPGYRPHDYYDYHNVYGSSGVYPY